MVMIVMIMIMRETVWLCRDGRPTWNSVAFWVWLDVEARSANGNGQSFTHSYYYTGSGPSSGHSQPGRAGHREVDLLSSLFLQGQWPSHLLPGWQYSLQCAANTCPCVTVLRNRFPRWGFTGPQLFPPSWATETRRQFPRILSSLQVKENGPTN